MRSVVLVSCLAACGRIGIDPRIDATESALADAAASIDVAPVVCATEGADCDDHDICTLTSTCTQGVCGPSQGACRVADSSEEYTDAQGDFGFFYGAWNLTLDTDGIYDPDTDFETFAWLAQMWRPTSWEEDGPNFTWAYIAPWGGHPASYPELRAPVRRWVSDVSGYANLVVDARKADPNSGDGIRVLAYVEGTLVLDRLVAFDDTVGFTATVPIEVDIGTRVDVLMHYNDNDGSDTSDLSFKVESR